MTHPLWKQWTEWKTKRFIHWGFDYLKFDFLSHGGIIALTANREINRIAASGVAFRPVDSAGDSASHAYTAQIDGSQYLALFTWNEAPETVTVDCLRAGLPADASWREPWSGKVYTSENGSITWHASGTDAAVLKMI